MKIEISEFVEGAGRAEGLAVIIDVFRAFSVECYAADAGASQIIATSAVEEAFRLRERYPGALLVGEREEKKVPGFDFGNSPTEILKGNIEGRTIIHTTTAGTQGLINAVKAEHVITGSFVNAAAIVRYIKHINPDKVCLIAMGYRAEESAEEDLLCARLIASRLEGTTPVSSREIMDLRNTSGKRFFNRQNIDFSPPTDFFLCTMTDRFDFILKAVKRTDGNMTMIKTEI